MNCEKSVNVEITIKKKDTKKLYIFIYLVLGVLSGQGLGRDISSLRWDPIIITPPYAYSHNVTTQLLTTTIFYKVYRTTLHILFK